jgi:Flp pilus assembly protein TadD
MVLALAKPELKLSFAALQWRGSAGDNPLITDLAPGFDAFRRDDFAEAARQLEPLERKHPASVEVFFYLGVAKLMQNDLPGARRALGTALGVADQAFAPDVAWYLAVAEERSGNPASARTRLDRLCRDGGARAADACEGARRLP